MNKEKVVTLGFQAEVKQLLNLMIHSLYSNKEIFLRELISNAADSADKLRFSALSDSKLYENQLELGVRISFDKGENTITVSDNGIGMNREEVINNLGTIAKSGTSEFLKNLTGDQKKDSQLIGKFGVGFYSSFIVADKVEILSRKAGLSEEHGVHWESSGNGEFSISNIMKKSRGTDIILHLKKKESEFADSFRLRSLIRKYSDHIAIPVIMRKDNYEDKEKSSVSSDAVSSDAVSSDAVSSDVVNKVVTDETVNKATALWTVSKSKIKETQYCEFYKHISHDYQDPILWSHNKVEGKLEYISLLYVPSKAPFDMWQRDAMRGIKLYVQRVFIMDDADQFLPLYLRFIKGVVDSNDLSLNISREILQKDPVIVKMRSALTKRVLAMLDDLSKKEANKYSDFWTEFGQVIKEGPAEDGSNKEKISRLLRFSSSFDNLVEQKHGFNDYIKRMKQGQKKIYYVVTDNFNTAKNSPHLEIFRKKGIEVLLLSDRVDEWLMSHLIEFDGKSLQDITKGILKLDDIVDQQEKENQEQQVKEFADLVERLKDSLGEKVQAVRITHRLTDSPACLVVGEKDMGNQMRKLMEAAGQSIPLSKPTFEINPEHPLVIKLHDETDEDRFNDLSSILFDQANLAEGGQLNDPTAYVSRLNTLLLELSV